MRGLYVNGAVFLLLAGDTVAVFGQTITEAAPRMPARGGTIVIKVDDYLQARQRVLDAAQQEGAEVVGAITRVNPKGRKSGWVRLQLPVERLPSLIPAIKSTGKLYGENLSTTEHVSEYEELERRVNRLREHEQRLGTLLESGRRLRGSDILYVQERMFRASVDEGLLMQRRVDLTRAARAGTLVVEMFEPEPVRALDIARIDLGQWFMRGRTAAGLTFQRAMARGVTLSAYLLVFAPVWVPALAVVLLLLRWLWRRRGVIWTQAARFWAFLRRELAARREAGTFLPPPAPKSTDS